MPRLFAPAKINLMLHLTGRDADGYHRLQSLAAFLECGDAVEARKNSILSLEITGPFAAGLQKERADNLVMRAAREFERAYHPATSTAILLDKQLPIASGIGGGSADAAAALLALAELHGVAPQDQQLQAIACKLGSDVPACFASTPVWMEGYGEQLSPVSVPPMHVVLLNPGIPLMTADVYRAVKPPFRASLPLPSFTTREHALGWLKEKANDLEIPARSLLPAIVEMIGAIASQEKCELARMSGSGATCFGIFPDADHAQGAAEALQRHYPQGWVKAARTISARSEHHNIEGHDGQAQ